MQLGKDYRSELNSGQVAELLDFADGLADQARRVAGEFPLDGSYIMHKSDGTGPVTSLDLLVERTWQGMISRKFPSHSIVGEETEPVNGQGDYVWLLDPIDGTDDLVRGIPLYGSIIAVLYRGFPIVGVIDHPELNIRCKAAFNLGCYRNGSMLNLDDVADQDPNDAIIMPAYTDYRKLDNFTDIVNKINIAFPNQRVYRNVYGHTLVASGRFGACLEVDVNVWDIMASQLIIEQANGVFVTLQIVGTGDRNRKISAVFGQRSTVNKVMAIIQECA